MAVSARTSDGLELTGWFWAPDDPSDDILLFLPGRAGNRDTAAHQAEPFAAGGRGVLVASYRGYGDNAGKPDEKGLYLDGAAFADLTRTMHTTGRLYLFGDGLGAAVALRLASRPDVSGTATLGAFDRFANFAPAAMRPMYANAFDNVAAIGRVKTPVLIM
ncbi:MAG: alpha/beta hydrolase, partial [Alphaproteobacteria bacterium]